MFRALQKAPLKSVALLLVTILLSCSCHSYEAPHWIYRPYQGESGFVPEADKYFMREINRQRKARGVAPLTLYTYPTVSLARNTRALNPTAHWAYSLARKQKLLHSRHIQEGMPAALRIGENVGRGSDPALIMKAFMESRSHRRNLLRPIYRKFVSATYINHKGIYYTCHRFLAEPLDPLVESSRVYER